MLPEQQQVEQSPQVGSEFAEGYNKMTDKWIVSYDVIEGFRNILAQEISDWYEEIRLIVEDENNDNFIKYWFLRSVIEVYTKNIVCNPKTTPDGVGEELKTKFKAGYNINQYVRELQNDRYVMLRGESYPPQNYQVLDDVGFLYHETQVWFMIWKKKNQSQIFFEDYIAPFISSDYVLADTNQILNFIYFKASQSLMKDIGDEYNPNLVAATSQVLGLQIINNLRLIRK